MAGRKPAAYQAAGLKCETLYCSLIRSRFFGPDGGEGEGPRAPGAEGGTGSRYGNVRIVALPAGKGAALAARSLGKHEPGVPAPLLHDGSGVARDRIAAVQVKDDRGTCRGRIGAAGVDRRNGEGEVRSGLARRDRTLEFGVQVDAAGHGDDSIVSAVSERDRD